MKCRNCKYLKIIFHECDLFGDNMPIEFKDIKGGCKLHYKELEKLNRLHDEFSKAINENNYLVYNRNEYMNYINHLLKKYGKGK